MGSAVWALVVASLLWGTTGTAASFMTDEVSPVAIGAATMAVGGALLFAVRARSSIAAIRRPDSRRWLLIGAVGVVAYPLAFYSSMDLAGVAIGNVVSLGSGPVFAAVLERVIDRRALSKRWMLAASTAVVGVALLAAGGHASASDAAATAVPLGVALGLLAGASYALYTFASGRVIARGVPSSAAMGAMFGLGAMPLAVVLVSSGADILDSASNLAIAAYLALGPMFLAYVLFGWGLRSLRSSSATVITLLEPVVATMLAVAIVGERLEPSGWIGLALILVGVAVVSTARRPARSD